MVRHSNKGIKSIRGTDYVLMAVIYTFIILLTMSIVIPFFIVFFQSVTPQEAMMGNQYSLIPKRFDFGAYKYLLLDSNQIGYCRDSVFPDSDHHGSLRPFQAVSSVPKISNLFGVYSYGF